MAAEDDPIGWHAYRARENDTLWRLGLLIEDKGDPGQWDLIGDKDRSGWKRRFPSIKTPGPVRVFIDDTDWKPCDRCGADMWADTERLCKWCRGAGHTAVAGAKRDKVDWLIDAEVARYITEEIDLGYPTAKREHRWSDRGRGWSTPAPRIVRCLTCGTEVHATFATNRCDEHRAELAKQLGRGAQSVGPSYQEPFRRSVGSLGFCRWPEWPAEAHDSSGAGWFTGYGGQDPFHDFTDAVCARLDRDAERRKATTRGAEDWARLESEAA